MKTTKIIVSIPIKEENLDLTGGITKEQAIHNYLSMINNKLPEQLQKVFPGNEISVTVDYPIGVSSLEIAEDSGAEENGVEE